MREPATDLKTRFDEVLEEGLAKIAAARDLGALEEVKIRTFGRKAPLSKARSSLRDVPADVRADLGRLASTVQTRLEEAFEAKQSAFLAADREARWAREKIDVTLPGVPPATGSLHPLTRTIWEIVDIFVGLGYRVAEGPEVELSKYNFDALNTPPDHPSRAPQDTFYIEGHGDAVCLRTQTSPMQMRVMEMQEPPVYVVVPGRVYRRDEQDATHLSQFAQIEGLAVDEGVSMGDLKGTLGIFAHEIFGKHLEVRLRPHHFPFTEPSGELDVECFACRGKGCRVCKQTGWIEVLGCGMVHPFLLEWVGYATDRYSGFAFGMGIERIAALAHGIGDIRYLYENDVRFLAHFRGMA